MLDLVIQVGLRYLLRHGLLYAFGGFNASHLRFRKAVLVTIIMVIEILYYYDLNYFI